MDKETDSSGSSSPNTTGSAGGVFIAIGGIVGALMGITFNQPSAGFLGGLAIGGLVALVVWLRER